MKSTEAQRAYWLEYAARQHKDGIDGVTNGLYKSRRRIGWSREDALNTPVGPQGGPALMGPGTKICWSTKSGTKRLVVLYQKFKDIRQRCYNEDHPAYERYGARGITVCDQWKEDYVAFAKWALPLVRAYKQEHGTVVGMSIDRIDNDGNYEPDNCEFIPAVENTRRMHAAHGHNVQEVTA
jgi:hypothetical protein